MAMMETLQMVDTLETGLTQCMVVMVVMVKVATEMVVFLLQYYLRQTPLLPAPRLTPRCST